MSESLNTKKTHDPSNKEINTRTSAVNDSRPLKAGSLDAASLTFTGIAPVSV